MAGRPALQVIMPRWHKAAHCPCGGCLGGSSLVAGQGASLAIAGAALLGELQSRRGGRHMLPAAPPSYFPG